MCDDDSVCSSSPLPLVREVIKATGSTWVKLVFAESTDKLIANLGRDQADGPAVSASHLREGLQRSAEQRGGNSDQGRLARWAFKLFDEYASPSQTERSTPRSAGAWPGGSVFSRCSHLQEKLGGDAAVRLGARRSTQDRLLLRAPRFQGAGRYGSDRDQRLHHGQPAARIKIGTVARRPRGPS